MLINMGLIYKRGQDIKPIWDEKPTPKKSNVNKGDKKKSRNPEFERYKERVWELTNQVKHLIEGIEDRGWRKFHIDHKISIKWGFDNNIPAKSIAHIDNLRMMWWKDNFVKNIVCEIDDKNKWIVGDLKIYEHRSDIYYRED
jgi:hypothetical protein